MRATFLLIPTILVLAGCTYAPEGERATAWWMRVSDCETYLVSLHATGLFRAMPKEGEQAGFTFSQSDPHRGLSVHVTGLSERWGGMLRLQSAEWNTARTADGRTEGWRIDLDPKGGGTIVGDFPEGTRDRRKLEEFHNFTALVLFPGQADSGLAREFLRERHESDDGRTNHFVDVAGPFRLKALLEDLIRRGPPLVGGGSGDGLLWRTLSWEDWTFQVGIPVRVAERAHESGRLALLVNGNDTAEFRFGSRHAVPISEVHQRLDETLGALGRDDASVQRSGGFTRMGGLGCEDAAALAPQEGDAVLVRAA